VSAPRLYGKVALVTGAASGIGLGIARRFVQEGARVVLGDVADLDAVAGELGPAVVTARADVTREADVEALAALAVERFGGLDIAVANAGRGAFAMVEEHPLEEWQAIMDLCLTGVFLTVKHAARVMRDGGSIVTIASLNATQPAAGMAAYCTAKAGVAMFSRVAAMELGARRIRVNAVGPGTFGFRSLGHAGTTPTLWELPGVIDEFLENTTVGRFAEPHDVAAVVAFLASDEASFVTGSFYPVDGGANTKRYPDLPGALARVGPAD
jgi:NAD(P)-dependent dehydrogenase (short-subunit alcohol dehydrogenase family)